MLLNAHRAVRTSRLGVFPDTEPLSLTPYSRCDYYGPDIEPLRHWRGWNRHRIRVATRVGSANDKLDISPERGDGRRRGTAVVRRLLVGPYIIVI